MTATAATATATATAECERERVRPARKEAGSPTAKLEKGVCACVRVCLW